MQLPLVWPQIFQQYSINLWDLFFVYIQTHSIVTHPVRETSQNHFFKVVKSSCKYHFSVQSYTFLNGSRHVNETVNLPRKSIVGRNYLPSSGPGSWRSPCSLSRRLQTGSTPIVAHLSHFQQTNCSLCRTVLWKLICCQHYVARG